MKKPNHPPASAPIGHGSAGTTSSSFHPPHAPLVVFPALPEPRSSLPLTLSMVRQARLATADDGGRLLQQLQMRTMSPGRGVCRDSPRRAFLPIAANHPGGSSSTTSRELVVVQSTPAAAVMTASLNQHFQHTAQASTSSSFAVFTDTLKSFWANKTMMSQELTNVHSSGVPPDFWKREYSIVKPEKKTAATPTGAATPIAGQSPHRRHIDADEKAALDEYDELRKRFVKLMFPSTALTNRSSTEALAHVMDVLLSDVEDPVVTDVVQRWHQHGSVTAPDALPATAGDHQAPTFNEEGAPEVISGSDNLSLVLSLTSHAPRRLHDESFAAAQRTITSIIMIGWRELVRQIFGTAGDAGILLEKIRTTVCDLLDNANRAAAYYKGLYDDVVALNVDKIVRELGADLAESYEKVQSLEHELRSMQQEVEEVRQLREEVAALKQREETYKTFMTRQLQRNALIMQMAVEGNPPSAAAVQAQQKVPLGRTNRLNSRVGMKRLNSTVGLPSPNATNAGAGSGGGGGVTFREGGSEGPRQQQQQHPPVSPASSFRFDGGGAFGADSSDVFAATHNGAAGGADEDQRIAGVPGIAGLNDDEEDEEYEEIEMIDACVQANTDAGSDDKLHEACNDFFREIEKAATLSQTICKGFYGSGDFLNPSACCIHAQELLGEITKRAMQLKERRVAAERAEQMLGQGPKSGAAGGANPSSPTGGSGGAGSPLLPKPDIEGLLSMTKAEHCKLLRDGAATAKELRLRLEALDGSDHFRRAISYKAPKTPSEPCSFCGRTELAKDAYRAKDLLIIANEKNDRLEREKLSLTTQLDKLQKRLEHERAISQHRADEMEKVMLKRRNLASTETQTDPVKTVLSAIAPPLDTPGTSDLSMHSGRAKNRRGSTEVTFDMLKLASGGGGSQRGSSISPNITPAAAGGTSSRRSSRSASTEDPSAVAQSSSATASALSALVASGVTLTKAQQYQFQLAAWMKDGWNTGGGGSSNRAISDKLSPLGANVSPVFQAASSASAGPRSLQWCLGLIHTLFAFVPPGIAARSAQHAASSTPPPPLPAFPLPGSKISTPVTAGDSSVAMFPSGVFPAGPLDGFDLSCCQHFTEYLKHTFVARGAADETASSFLSSVALFSHEPRLHLFSRFFLDEFSAAAYREFLGFNQALDSAITSCRNIRLDLATSANTLPLHVVLVQIFAYFGKNDRFASCVDVCRELAVIAVARSIVSSSSAATLLESATDAAPSPAAPDTSATQISPAEVPEVARSQYSVTLPDNWLAREIPRAAFLEELAGAIEKHLIAATPSHPQPGDPFTAFLNSSPLTSALGYAVHANSAAPIALGSSKSVSDTSRGNSSSGNRTKERGGGPSQVKPLQQVPKRPANSAGVVPSSDRSRRQTMR